MEGDTCVHFAHLLVTEGEEHVADMLGPEVGGVGRELVTDSTVPVRLRGRHKEYEKLGAEPYIVESELLSADFSSFPGKFLMRINLQPFETATDWCSSPSLRLPT